LIEPPRLSRRIVKGTKKVKMSPLAVEVDRLSVEKLREYEMEEARNLQRAMVPEEPLWAQPLEIASKFRPVAEVGGDFLDYFLLSDHTVGLYLGDVVGKGLPAAFYAALTVGTLRGINKTGELPAPVLELLNERLRLRTMPKRYCAVQYALFDPATRVLRFANAGLPRPLHISAAGCRELGEGGLPSGMFPSTRYAEHNVCLACGDAVLFATDGLTEAQNPDREEFGTDQLMGVCAQNHCESATTLLDRIFAAVDKFVRGHPQHDDMAVAVLKLH